MDGSNFRFLDRLSNLRLGAGFRMKGRDDARDAEVARLEHLLQQEHGRFNKFESQKFLQLEVDNWASGIRQG